MYTGKRPPTNEVAVSGVKPKHLPLHSAPGEACLGRRCGVGSGPRPGPTCHPATRAAFCLFRQTSFLSNYFKISSAQRDEVRHTKTNAHTYTHSPPPKKVVKVEDILDTVELSWYLTTFPTGHISRAIFISRQWTWNFPTTQNPIQSQPVWPPLYFQKMGWKRWAHPSDTRPVWPVGSLMVGGTSTPLQ